MRYWIIGLLVMCLIVVGGIFLSAGFAIDNKAIDGQGIGILPTTSGSSNMLPNTLESVTTAPSTNVKTALSADEKVSVAALTCTIKDSGGNVVDLRYENRGIENRTIMIDPSGVKLYLLPNTTYRYYLHLIEEVSILTISVDDGTEFQVDLPNCTAQGGSGSGGLGGQGLTLLDPNPSDPIASDPTPSVPIASDPTPSVPIASDPTPSVPIASDPTPSVPIASEPTPSVPIASEPTPSVPTPTPPVPELSPLVLTLAGISGLLLLSRIRKN